MRENTRQFLHDAPCMSGCHPWATQRRTSTDEKQDKPGSSSPPMHIPTAGGCVSGLRAKNLDYVLQRATRPRGSHRSSELGMHRACPSCRLPWLELTRPKCASVTACWSPFVSCAAPFCSRVMHSSHDCVRSACSRHVMAVTLQHLCRSGHLVA